MAASTNSDKLKKVYDLYTSSGLIKTTDFNTFSNASDEQKKKLYDLGVNKGLFKSTDYNTFSTAWVKKKEPTQEVAKTPPTGGVSASGSVQTQPTSGLKPTPKYNWKTYNKKTEPEGGFIEGARKELKELLAWYGASDLVEQDAILSDKDVDGLVEEAINRAQTLKSFEKSFYGPDGKTVNKEFSKSYLAGTILPNIGYADNGYSLNPADQKRVQQRFEQALYNRKAMTPAQTEKIMNNININVYNANLNNQMETEVREKERNNAPKQEIEATKKFYENSKIEGPGKLTPEQERKRQDLRNQGVSEQDIKKQMEEEKKRVDFKYENWFDEDVFKLLTEEDKKDIQDFINNNPGIKTKYSYYATRSPESQAELIMQAIEPRVNEALNGLQIYSDNKMLEMLGQLNDLNKQLGVYNLELNLLKKQIENFTPKELTPEQKRQLEIDKNQFQTRENEYVQATASFNELKAQLDPVFQELARLKDDAEAGNQNAIEAYNGIYNSKKEEIDKFNAMIPQLEELLKSRNQAAQILNRYATSQSDIASYNQYLQSVEKYNKIYDEVMPLYRQQQEIVQQLPKEDVDKMFQLYQGMNSAIELTKQLEKTKTPTIGDMITTSMANNPLWSFHSATTFPLIKSTGEFLLKGVGGVMRTTSDVLENFVFMKPEDYYSGADYAADLIGKGFDLSGESWIRDVMPGYEMKDFYDMNGNFVYSPLSVTVGAFDSIGVIVGAAIGTAAMGGAGSNAAIIAPMFFATYDDNKELAKQLGYDSKFESMSAGVLFSLIEGVSELILPDVKFFQGDAKKQLFKMFLDNYQQGGKTVAIKSITEAIAKEYGEELAVEFGKVITTAMTSAFGGNNQQYTVTGAELFQTFVFTALASGSLKTVNVIGTSSNSFNNAMKFEMAKDLKSSIEMIESYRRVGKMNDVKADQLKKELTVISSVQGQLPDDLSQSKRVVVSGLYAERAALEQKMNDPNVTNEVKEGYKSAINKINTKISQVIVADDTEFNDAYNKDLEEQTNKVASEIKEKYPELSATPKGEAPSLGTAYSYLGKDKMELSEQVQETPTETKPGVETKASPITIEESINSQKVFDRNGEKGVIKKEGQIVVLEKANGDVIELGNIDQVKDKSISDFNIKETVDIILNEDNSFDVNGKKYVNNYSNPESAISVDKDGNYSVTLDTPDGKKRTFRGERGEEMAYRIKLKQLENEGNEQAIDRAIQLTDEAIAAETKPREVAPKEEVRVTREVEPTEAEIVSQGAAPTKAKEPATKKKIGGVTPAQQQDAEAAPAGSAPAPIKVTVQGIESLPTDVKVNTEFTQEDGTVSPVMGNEKVLFDLYNKSVETPAEQRSEQQNNIISLTEKLTQDAIQVETAGQVPVQSEAGTRQEVEEGKPQAEPQAPAQEGQEVETAANNNIRESIKQKLKMFGVNDAVKKVVNLFRKSGLRVVVIDDPNEFERVTGAENAQGIFRSDEGVIYLNPAKFEEGLGRLVVYHEGIHPIINIIRNTDPKLYNAIRDGLKKLSESNNDVAQSFRWVEANSINRDPLSIEDEQIVETFARIADGRISIDSIPQTLMDRIVEFFNTIALSMGLGRPFRQGDLKSAASIARQITKALQTGEGLEGIVGKGNVGKYQYVDNNGDAITENDLQYRIVGDFTNLTTGITFEYLQNSDEFNKLVEQGFITNDMNLEDFQDAFVVLHSPDAAFSGNIKKNGKVLVDGSGGVYYPIKFHKDGYIWASTKSGAASLANLLNESARLNNGRVLLALTAAPKDKLLSSTTMANGVIDIFTSKIMDEKVNLRELDVVNTLKNAAKAVAYDANGNAFGLRLNLTGLKNLDEIVTKIKERLSPDKSSFKDRKLFSLTFLEQIATKIKGKEAEQILGRFLSEEMGFEEYKQQGKIENRFNISKTNLTEAISNMLQEPLLRTVKENAIYAVIEVDASEGYKKGKPVVKVIESDKHDSYPNTIVPVNDKANIRLHILQDRKSWMDNIVDPQTDEIIKKDQYKKLYPPIAGVSKFPVKIKTQFSPAVSRMSVEKPGMDTIKAANLTPAEVANWRKENKVSQREGRVSEVQQSAQDLADGKKTIYEHIETVRAIQPTRKTDRLKPMPSVKEVVSALADNQVKTGVLGLNVGIPEGTKVGSRLDIPSFNNYGINVVSVHDGTASGTSIGYGRAVSLSDVTFKTSPSQALNVATGASKGTFSRMMGTWNNESEESVFNRAKEAMNDPEWIQIGTNPFRHSWFYDKETGMPVMSASEILQVGNVVLAKDARVLDLTNAKDKAEFEDKFRVNLKDGKIGQFSPAAPRDMAEKFFEDMDVVFPNDHILGGYAATDPQGKLLGRILMSYVDENTVKIDEIVSEKRGQMAGNGSAIMRIITENADKNNISLTLTPNLIGDMKAKGFETPEKLRSFYQKFGFTRDAQKATMTRVPNQGTTQFSPAVSRGDVSKAMNKAFPKGQMSIFAPRGMMNTAEVARNQYPLHMVLVQVGVDAYNNQGIRNYSSFITYAKNYDDRIEKNPYMERVWEDVTRIVNGKKPLIQSERDYRDFLVKENNVAVANAERLKKRNRKDMVTNAKTALFDSRAELFKALSQSSNKLWSIAANYVNVIGGMGAKSIYTANFLSDSVFKGLSTKNEYLIGDQMQSESTIFNNVLVRIRVLEIQRKMEDKFNEFKALDNSYKNETDPAKKQAFKDARDNVRRYLDRNNMLQKNAAGEFVLGTYQYANNLNERTAYNELLQLKQQYPDLYDKLMERAETYHNAFTTLLKMQKDAGMLSQESYDEMVKYKYVPMRYIGYMIEDIVVGDKIKTNKKQSDLIKRLKGGSEDNVDMAFDEALKFQAYMVIRAIAKNNAMQKIYEAAKSENFQGPFYEPDVTGVDADGNFEYGNIPAEDAIIYFFIDGKRMALATNEDIAKSFNGSNIKFNDLADEKLGYLFLTTPFRAVTTNLNPGFGLAQLILDIPQALLTNEAYSNITTGLPRILFRDLKLLAGKGFGSLFKSLGLDIGLDKEWNELANEAREYGGLITFTGMDNETMGVVQASEKAKDKKTNILTNLLVGYRDKVELFGTTMETVTRLAVYRKIRNNLKSEYRKNNNGQDPKGEDLDNILTQAAATSLNVLNYNRGGTIVKGLNRALAYLNVAFQVPYSVIKYAKRKPFEFSLKAMEVALWPTLVSLLCYLSIDDDDDKEKYLEIYNNYNEYEKANYWHIYNLLWDGKDPETMIIRIKKPTILLPLINSTEVGVMYAATGGKTISPKDYTRNQLPSDIVDMQPLGLDLISSVPSFNAFSKYVFNKDFYRNIDVVKNEKELFNWEEGQNDPNVGKFYKYVAERTKYLGDNDRETLESISPARMDAAVKSAVGNYETNITTALPLLGAEGLLSWLSSDYSEFKVPAQTDEETKSIMEKVWEGVGLKKRFFAKVPEVNPQIYNSMEFEKKMKNYLREEIRSMVDVIISEKKSIDETKQMIREYYKMVSQDNQYYDIKNLDSDLKNAFKYVNNQKWLKDKPKWYRTLIFAPDTESKILIFDISTENMDMQEKRKAFIELYEKEFITDNPDWLKYVQKEFPKVGK